ncbi:hypothetical protein [Alloyangia pacifica]|nr:hypothetical protein [Alloyangia pacifica]
MFMVLKGFSREEVTLHFGSRARLRAFPRSATAQAAITQAAPIPFHSPV